MHICHFMPSVVFVSCFPLAVHFSQRFMLTIPSLVTPLRMAAFHGIARFVLNNLGSYSAMFYLVFTMLLGVIGSRACATVTKVETRSLVGMSFQVGRELPSGTGSPDAR